MGGILRPLPGKSGAFEVGSPGQSDCSLGVAVIARGEPRG